MDVETCPCCGMMHTSPVAITRSVSWTDTCACSDLGRCVRHQISPEDAPQRPSEEVLLARAMDRCSRNEKKWLELKATFAKVKKFLDDPTS